MWKINYSKWHMQGEPNSVPLILVIKSDSYNLFGVIPTYTKVEFGIDYLNQRGVWNAHVFVLTLCTHSYLPRETVLMPYVALSEPTLLFIPYNIMWIPKIHRAIYSTRYLITQLLFVVFQCRGVILRRTNTKHFSYFIVSSWRKSDKNMWCCQAVAVLAGSQHREVP